MFPSLWPPPMKSLRSAGTLYLQYPFHATVVVQAIEWKCYVIPVLHRGA